MPPRRQLPWANKGASSKTQAKPSLAKRPVLSDIDDDFFDGTVLGSSWKGKRREDAQRSDDELPELPCTSKRISRKSGEPSRGAQLLSSSPPPIAADLPPPKTVYMLTGIDKFDLRDDEWMMVEDELLQTAKLFTQHLHLAEYETLKAKMEEHRKAATARPVVADAKLSVEGQFKLKAREQAQNQKKAVREAYSRRGDSSEDDEVPPPRVVSTKFKSSLPSAKPASMARSLGNARPLPTSKTVSSKTASDSDDLDAPKRPPIETSRPSVATAKPPEGKAPAKEPSSFKKPAMPSRVQTKPARGQRRNLWDDWDELTADSKATVPEPSHPKTSHRVPSPTKPASLFTTSRPASSSKPVHTPTASRTGNGLPRAAKLSTNIELDPADIATPLRNPLAKETADWPVKRKADKERDDKKKPKYDDIPTFLF
ncbi:hypothetical protein BU23DRAFT_540904 [Bimuria novae-zelandiae CBS 107.79]|uniref:Uncharacterized protein n=1 Tax=Bimuria novae-zelandiae CBS 107.79 TaxID=1447943 RepID=A0A6A5UXU7_9PLEO|nr:hypothetical protein BU23DRAFT_540904 [Bimuria novae-zelandiae CBS 107.79]